MVPECISYEDTQFPNIDPRLIELSTLSEKEGLEFVIVKGTSWNKGQILEGSDLDFYMTRDKQYLVYEVVPAPIKDYIKEEFRDLLVVPRGDDFDSKIRAKEFYIDCVTILRTSNGSFNFAEAYFINPESRLFYENGILEISSEFEICPKFIRFTLNRMLEETGRTRRMTPYVYEESLDAITRLGLPVLYTKLLKSFERVDGLYKPVLDCDLASEVKEFILNGGLPEYLIYVKPLNKAYKALQVKVKME
jgi:hypothetical protein